MRRAILFFIKVAVLVALAVWLVERPGHVEIAWQGQIIETSVGVLILAVAALMLVAALAYRLWRGLVRAPSRLRQRRHARRRERGYRALTQGMVAVAAGDADGARRYARRADALLHEPPLTMLLQAQAAQLNGNNDAARDYFTAMLERPETEFLGLRGLLNQALRKDDSVRALEIAHRARRLRPDTPWVLRTCFDLEVRARRWASALETLEAAVKAGVVDSETGRRHRAAILLERSREAEGSGDTDAAYAHVHRATGLMPAFAPAVAREAVLLGRRGRARQAAKLIEKAWETAPHRDLLEAYLSLGPADEDPLARVKRVEALHRRNPDSAESLTALGEIELAAQLWGSARSHLLQAEARAPTRRVYRLLADLEQSERGDIVAGRNWLAKASAAEPDPAWTCTECGAVSPHWSALCGHCQAFDTLTWQAPTRAVHLPLSGTAPVPALRGNGHDSAGRSEGRLEHGQAPVAPAAGGATAL